jgi:hypothetical protein
MSRNDLLRSSDDVNGAVSPAALPRFTSRPPDRNDRAAATAGVPNSGSSTRSTGPSTADANRAVNSSRSAVSSGTTASAPAAFARSCPAADLAAATTRRAPASRASCTAA